MEEDPFFDLNIDSAEFLNGLGGRSKCPKCKKSRKYYCYTCYVPVPEIADRVPNVKLPIKVDIIKHPSEVDGKSTAVHAGVIAHDDVTIYTYPCVPDYDKDKVVLVFPGEGAVSLADLADTLITSLPVNVTSLPVNVTSSAVATVNNSRRMTQNIHSQSGSHKRAAESSQNSETGVFVTKRSKPNDLDHVKDSSLQYLGSSENTLLPLKMETVSTNKEKYTDIDPKGNLEGLDKVSKLSKDNTIHVTKKKEGISSLIERVVFVDSTWNQTRTVCSDERLKGLKRVEIQKRKTKFWRHQKDIPDTYLSTVEAIYYFLRDYHDHFVQSEYKGEYDNLLFFFTFMYKKIRNLYDGGEELLAFKQRKEKENV